MIDGLEIFQKVAQDLSLDFGVIIARCSFWAAPELVAVARAEHKDAAKYPKFRRANAGEKRGETINGITLDDNSRANLAIKQAVFGGRAGCVNFHACHIWPKSCYNANYHTSLANLVLLPAPLAALSDHEPNIRAILQYRAYELYDWRPEGEPAPDRPVNYPSSHHWRLPLSPSISCVNTMTDRDHAVSNERNATSNSDLTELKERILARLFPNHSSEFLRDGRSLFLNRRANEGIFIRAANLNASGSYWFDIYDDRLARLPANGELAFGFGDKEEFFTIRQPMARSAFCSLQTRRSKQGRLYRQVYFEPKLGGGLAARDNRLGAVLMRHEFAGPAATG